MRLLAPLVATVATVAIALPAAPADAARPIPRKAPACQHEDSRGCVWDALHRGNGIGRSFYVTPRGKHYRITHKRAHRMAARYYR